MDFLTILKYVLAVVEIGALIGAMVFSARGMKERKDQSLRKSLLTQAVIYFAVYIILNMVRLKYFPA